MDVRIAQPLGYSELGGRSNNEDSIFPDPQFTSPLQKWFLVCDGVGGAERGEVASKLAVNSFDAFFQQQPVAVPSDEYIQQAIAYAEDQFNAYFVETPQALGMATTVTLLYFHEAGATVAHIGDSRVYHLRRGEIIWRTDDHSYVNELVRAGVLTPDEAHRHPQRNIITRALQGGEKRVHASVQVINDVRPGDYFFLCSDGVLERISDELLEGTLRSKVDSNEQKLAKLREYSTGNTRDNFTAYLLQVDYVTGTVAPHYQVAAPVYERLSSDTDADEGITLINVPVPEPDAVGLVDTPAESAPVAATNVPDVQPVAVAGVPTLTSQISAKSEPDTKRLVASPPARPSSNWWLVAVLGIAGALLGAGGIMAWQHFSTNVAVTDALTTPGKSIISTVPVPHSSRSAATSAITKSAVTDARNEAVSDPTSTSAASITTLTGRADAEEGLSIVHNKAQLPKTETNHRPSEKVIRPVDKQLSVVQDPETSLMGLKNSDGKWVTKAVYTQIDPFEKGIAAVKTNKGPERYLSKEGEKFTTFSGYKDGLATLTGVDGHKLYLSTNGKWFTAAKAPSNGKIAVREGTKWGYLNMQGARTIYPQYDEAGSFGDDGTAEVTLNNKTFRIDKAGNKVTGKSSTATADKKGTMKKG